MPTSSGDPDATQHTDVVVLGGGLAGLTVALQIKQARPETTILVLERRRHPVPEAAFKVGESTLEGAAHYFGTTLGMQEHLATAHLLKFGLRFFLPYGDNSDITRRPEIGSFALEGDAPLPSYQIDRGRFENALGEKMRHLGVTFWDDCKVTGVALHADRHTVTCRRHGGECTVATRWVVDASGRAGLLKRQLGLAKRVNHSVNAAWFRVRGSVNTHDWSAQRAWQARVDDAQLRTYCTTHLMGPGYWVWIIPLASAATSIGIVADATLHPLETFNRLERGLAWLQAHEPQCAQAIRRDAILDFHVLRHYAHSCTQVFSSERWCLTGEAGVFTDPLYSPGSEMIAVSNTFITDLIVRALGDEDIAQRVARYNQFYLDLLFDVAMREYVGQYPHFGDAQLVTLKKVWQAAWYWGILALLISHTKHLCDLDFLSAVAPDLQRFHALQVRVQDLFRTWSPQHPPDYHDLHVDYPQMQSLAQVYDVLRMILDSEQLKHHITEHVSFLEAMAAEIFRRVRPAPFPAGSLDGARTALAADFQELIWDQLSCTNQPAK